MGLVATKPVFGGLRTTQAQTSLRIPKTDLRFVIRLLESIISKLASSEISIVLLVSVAVETGLSPLC